MSPIIHIGIPKGIIPGISPMIPAGIFLGLCTGEIPPETPARHSLEILLGIYQLNPGGGFFRHPS